MATLNVTLRDLVSGTAMPRVRLSAVAVAVAAYRQRMVEHEEDYRRSTGPLSEVVSTRVKGASDYREIRNATRIMPPVEAVTSARGVATFVWPHGPSAPLSVAYREKLAIRPSGGQTPSVYVAFLVGVDVGSEVQYAQAVATTVPWGTVDEAITVDLGTAVLGDVTDTSAHIGFRSHVGERPFGRGVICEVFGPPQRARRSRLLSTQGVVLDHALGDTARIELTGLAPQTAYSYVLRVDGGDEVVLARGQLVTRPWLTVRPFRGGSLQVRDNSTRIAFASCHGRTPDGLRLWAALHEWRPDLVLLMGDQVYGDTEYDTQADQYDTNAMRHPDGPRGAWFGYYADRYRREWRPREVRQVLAGHPVISVPDDHDVRDDWGTEYRATNSQHRPRIAAGLAAFHAFSPPTRPMPSLQDVADTALDEAFGVGVVGGYVLDCRTQRGRSPVAPLLGQDQRDRFVTWCEGPARSYDVVVLVAPIPLVFADADDLEGLLKLIDWLPAGGAALGGFIGGAVGLAIGGPPGWVAGTVVGAAAGSIAGLAGEEYIAEQTNLARGESGEIVEPDVRDHWAYKDSRADLASVVKALFALANDDLGGGARRRAVIVVSGDIHLGAFHELRATGQRQVERILQATSSPLGQTPPSSLADGSTPLLSALLRNEYMLFRDGGQDYRGQILGEFLVAPNFGTLTVDQPDPGRRRYEVRLKLRGVRDSSQIEVLYDLDNDANPQQINRGVVPAENHPGAGRSRP